MQSWIDLKMMLPVMRFQVGFFSVFFSVFFSIFFSDFSSVFSSSPSSSLSQVVFFFSCVNVLILVLFDSPSPSFLSFLAIYAFLTNAYFYEQILDAILFFPLFFPLFPALFICRPSSYVIFFGGGLYFSSWIKKKSREEAARSCSLGRDELGREPP
ncbi:hypothetical protein J3F84DRAFT_367730 [Trichoderma pleuroticola]